MTRSRTHRRLAVAVLILVLLLPSAAGAREPWTLLRSGERSVFVALWDLVYRVFQDGQAKHRGQMDPNGLAGTVADPDNDHRGQIDPNG